MTSRWKAALRLVRGTGMAAVFLLLARCAEQPTGPAKDPSLVVRGYSNGCVPQVITTSTNLADTTLTTFTTPFPDSMCFPNLVQWGIDMADPIGVDTPQGNGYFQVQSNNAANLPSPLQYALGANYSPPQVMIEFDPPVKSVEFSYSRLSQARAIWGGLTVNADSMLVRAMSRTPGTLNYFTYDSKVLRSNVPSTTVPWNVWTNVKLPASGNYIQWCWFDGTLAIDNLKVTRDKPCPQVGDSAFDNSTAIKHGLNREWNVANGEQLERGGWVMHNTTTQQDSVWFDPTNQFRDRCNILFNLPPSWPGWVPVEGWHAHIIKGGDPVGTNCRGHPDPTVPAHDGPSGTDNDLANRTPMYHQIIIDVDGIHVVYPPATPGLPTLESGHKPWGSICRQI